jgi:hypothetical protein
MKTLKISIVATIAMVFAWRLRLPHRLWPGHPYLADLFMALLLCLVLQIVWTDAKTSPGKNSR